MSDFITGAGADAAGFGAGRWLGRRTLGLSFECSMRTVDSAAPPPSGLTRRWRTGAAEVDGHLLTFSAYWASGIRFPRRRGIQLEVAEIDFDKTRNLSHWESWYLALAADTAVEFTTRTGHRIEWALPLQRLESFERRWNRPTPPA